MIDHTFFIAFIYVIGVLLMTVIIYEASDKRDIQLVSQWDYVKALFIIVLSWFAILAILIRGGTEW